MGGSVSCIALQGDPCGSISVIHSDGQTTIFDKPLTAGEVTREYPCHSLCDSDSLYIGQKIPALPPEEELQLGHRYFLLPDRSFRSALSLVSLASLGPPPAGGRGHMNCFAQASLLVAQPFEVQKTAAGGGLQIKVRGEFVATLIAGGKSGDRRTPAAGGGLCSTPELQKDYAQLVTSRGQLWRPKLETISEREPVAGRFGLSLRSVNRRKRSPSQLM